MIGKWYIIVWQKISSVVNEKEFEILLQSYKGYFNNLFFFKTYYYKIFNIFNNNVDCLLS